MLNKKIIRISAIIIAGTISSLFIPSTASAAEFHFEEENTDVTISEITEDDLYIRARDIVIEEDVHGDIIAFGKNVTIQDDIYGDVLVFALSVKIEGTVRGDVHCAAASITLTGDVEGDVTVAAGKISISGDVDNTARAAGWQVDVNGDSVGGDLVVRSGTGSIDSSLTVDGEENIEIGQGMDVKDYPLALLQNTFQPSASLTLSSFIMRALRRIGIVLGWMAVGSLLFYLMPVKSKLIVDTLSDKKTTVKSLAIGIISLISLIIIIPILVILANFGIGFPLLAFVTAVFGLIFTVSGIYGVTGVTRLIFKAIKGDSYKNYFIPMLIGIFVYSIGGILSFICCAGCLTLFAQIFVSIWGMGGIILTIYQIKFAKKQDKV